MNHKVKYKIKRKISTSFTVLKRENNTEYLCHFHFQDDILPLIRVMLPPTENFNCVDNIVVKRTVWILYSESSSNKILQV